MEHPETIHVACLRSSPPPSDLAFIYHCYQCNQQMFAGRFILIDPLPGKYLGKSEANDVKCPLEKA